MYYLIRVGSVYTLGSGSLPVPLSKGGRHLFYTLRRAICGIGDQPARVSKKLNVGERFVDQEALQPVGPYARLDGYSHARMCEEACRDSAPHAGFVKSGFSPAVAAMHAMRKYRWCFPFGYSSSTILAILGGLPHTI